MADTVKLTVKHARERDVLADLFRVHYSHRSFARPGDVVLVRIGNKKTYANARPHDKKGEVCFDRATREKLGVEVGQVVEVVFEKTRLWGQIRWAWTATDAMPRIAARLSAVSVGLGLIGLTLGVVSLCR